MGFKEWMDKQEELPSPLYYGCWDDVGHYLHRVSGMTISLQRVEKELPWGYHVDGGLAPQNSGQIQGQASLHHKDGWTALSFWDRTVDKRPGSSSTFLAKGTYDFEAMKKIAQENFPSIWQRFPFEITEK